MNKRVRIPLATAALALGAVTAFSGAVLLPAAAQAGDSMVQLAKGCNPCAGKNPCAAKKGCNPCATKNPCAAKKGCNPCAGKNPCAAKKGCNPCNPCKAK